jgi:hypothetical protein
MNMKRFFGASVVALVPMLLAGCAASGDED